MPSWKLNIFKRAVIIRYEAGEEGTVEELVATYPKLTTGEQQEVIAVVNAELSK